MQTINQEQLALKRLLRDYKVLLKAQVRCYFGEKESKIINKMLAYMSRHQMIYIQERYVALNKRDFSAVDDKRLKAFWVLLGLLDVEYHNLGDWPVEICFVKQGGEGEIIYVALGEEKLINAVLMKNEVVKRIVIVEEPEQIVDLDIDGVAYYCTVDEAGSIEKYVKE